GIARLNVDLSLELTLHCDGAFWNGHDKRHRALVHVKPFGGEGAREARWFRKARAWRGQARERHGRRYQIVERCRVRIDVVPVIDLQRDHDLVILLAGPDNRGSADVVRRLGSPEGLAGPAVICRTGRGFVRRGKIRVRQWMEVEDSDRRRPYLRLLAE